MRIYNIFNSALGDGSPFASRSKMIGEELLGSIVGAGASALGNLFGFASNNSANKTNLQIAKMNNEQQYKMFREQNAFNLDMWNKNNEYNLPANQVKRLLAAGINPSAVFGNGSVTPSSQIQSATAPQLHSAQVRPFTPDFSGVGDSVNAFFDNQIKTKSAQSLGLDNAEKQIDLQFRAMQHLQNLIESRARVAKSLSEVSKNSAEYSNMKKQAEMLDLDINRYRDTYDDLVKREKLQNDVYKNQSVNLIADATLKRAQASFQNMMSTYYPQITQAQLDVMSAQFDDLVQSAALKAKEGELTSARSISQYIQNGILAMEYENKELKHHIKYGSGKVPQAFWYTLDMIGDAIFGNIRLLGK